MAPANTQDKDKDKSHSSLNADQTKLLCEVMTQAKVALTPAQWTDVASNLGISNGKAAKERFRYLMTSLSGAPTRVARGDGGEKDVSAPKSAAKSVKTSGTPVSAKVKKPKTSTKKTPKAITKEYEEEDDQAADTSTVAKEMIEPEVPLTSIPTSKYSLVPPPITRTSKSINEKNLTNDHDVHATMTDYNTFHPNTSLSTPQPTATNPSQDITITYDMRAIKKRKIDEVFDVDEFGVIGGGSASMFSTHDDGEMLI